ncbi:MAG TPA: TonB-dependent receptor, partial [Thermoanaerobaculia bacterium]|nr:TonB-dependent receptor [Thermoanaerobaculia bacterium]
WCLGVVLALAGSVVMGQARTTGFLTGKITGPDGIPLPGVNVRATSPALQGERTATTVASGEFILRDLPAGIYEVELSLEGMATEKATVTVEIGRQDRLEVAMKPAAVSEEILVTAEAPSALETTEVSANFDAEEVDSLAVNREIDDIADLAPGLTQNVANTDQITINGGFGYDNKFLVNGVEINDNVFGVFDDLYIEDAVQETQVLTSGISSEYGRFGGGVVNIITKNGGNDFHGTVRADVQNPSWRDETQFEDENDVEREDKRSEIYSATLGGFIVRDRLWFFLAGRDFEDDRSDTLDVTGIQISPLDTNERYEAKITGNIAVNHSIQVAYTESDTEQTDVKPIGQTIDPNGLMDAAVDRDLIVGRYSGVLTASAFVEAQYSEKSQESVSGGFPGPVEDATPFIAFGINLPEPVSHYNGPIFDQSDPESRDNEQLAGNFSYFLSTESAGTHDFKVGAERFVDINQGGNSQSPTSNDILADYVQDDDGNPVLGPDGRIQPIFFSLADPNLNGITFRRNWLADRGARLEVTTDSLYVNDRWTLGDRWSFNLGARYEDADSEATGGITAVDMSRLVPRVGASYDIKGDGHYVVDATFAQYSGGNTIINTAANSSVANPDLALWLYVGPGGVGRDFAPGFDFDNPDFWIPNFIRFNRLNVITEGLDSPITSEYTLSFGQRIGTRGFYKATWVDRDTDDIVENQIFIENGQTEVFSEESQPVLEGGFFGDNQIYGNSDVADRDYEAIQIQADYRLTDHWRLAGNYTYQIKNEGNFVGEATNQPVLTSAIDNYPEMFNGRNISYGRLPSYQEHKVRVWSTYGFDFGRVGGLNLGLLVNYDSGTAYSLEAADFPLTAQQAALNPGYAGDPTDDNHIFFGDRGARLFGGATTADLAAIYSLPIYKRLEVWVKGEVRNLLNDDSLIGFDTTIQPDTDGPVDSLGLPLDFVEGPNFGEGDSSTDYVVPREYRVSVGVRF